MEDDLSFEMNGRPPQFYGENVLNCFEKWETTKFFGKMGDDLDFIAKKDKSNWKIEDK
jgi:hypothetical protein